jgi:hypothetical protein
MRVGKEPEADYPSEPKQSPKGQMLNRSEIISSIEERVRHGVVLAVDVQWVSAQLTCKEDNESYRLVELLGESRDFGQRQKLESLLHCELDPYLSAIALRVLCQDWGLATEYNQLLKKFIIGVPWDDTNELRDAALSAAGDSLYDKEDPRLLQEIVRVYDNASTDDELRGFAFRSIWLAAKRDLRELIPREGARLPSEDELSEVLANARQRAAGA